MDLKSFNELRADWEALTARITDQFGVDPDLQGILFLIGVQELGQGFKDFSKDQKQDLMHIATCRVLSIYGFYELKGLDEQGWPHWENRDRIPPLTLKEQDLLLKQAVLDYFKEESW